MGNASETKIKLAPAIVGDASHSRTGIRGYWIWSALFVALAFAVMPFDQLLGDPNNMEAMPGDLKRIVTLSEIFAHGFGIAVVGGCIWLLSSSHRKLVPRIVMCAVWPALGVHLVKLMVARFRPIKYFDELSQAHFPGRISETFLGFMPGEHLNTTYVQQSFPSAHAATAWGLAIGLSWAFPKGRWFFVGIAVLAAIQRVTSFAHWASDVFCGIAIAFLMAGALTHNWGIGWVLHRIENRWPEDSDSYEGQGEFLGSDSEDQFRRKSKAA